MARNILRIFSACLARVPFNGTVPNCVTPATMRATSLPKVSMISSSVYWVSSTTSCKRPAAMLTASSSCRLGCRRPPAGATGRVPRKAASGRVDAGRKDVGPVDDVQVGFRVVFGDLVEDVGDPDHASTIWRKPRAGCWVARSRCSGRPRLRLPGEGTGWSR